MHVHAPPSKPTDGLRVGRTARVVLLAITAVCLMLTVAGLVWLWPDGDRDAQLEGSSLDAPGVTFPSATVTGVRPYDCPAMLQPGSGGVTPDQQLPSSQPGSPGATTTCAHVTARVEDGTSAGEQVEVTVSSAQYDAGIADGDAIQLVRVPGTSAAPGDAGTDAQYSFLDFERGPPLAWLAVAFAVVVVAVARLRGLLSVVGVGFAFLVLGKFLLPALLSGEDAFAVGLVGSSAILFVVLYLAHGPSLRTTTALLGTLAGAGITAAIGALAIDAAQLTGLSGDEDTTMLTAVAGDLSLRGLLSCGIIIAGLGVLNDVTITQSSAVWELRSTDPAMSRRRLYAAAIRIGRDHIASSVYTIVFAYAGAALPLLLLIDLVQRPLGEVLVTEAFGEEIVRTLASAIGLVLAVPFTTAIATLVAPRAAGATRTESGPHDPPSRPRDL